MIDKHEEYLERLAVEDLLLLAAVVLLPWAFGGVEVWGYRSASLLIALAAALALVKRGPAGLGLTPRARWLLPAFLLAGWAVFQLVPLPPWVVRVVSPEAHRVYERAFPGYGGEAPDDPMLAIEVDALARVPEVAPAQPGGPVLDLEDPPVRAGWRPLSLNPYATLERLFWYAALLMAFLLALERTRDPVRARIYRSTLFGAFVLLALFALLQAAAWNGRMFWIGPSMEGKTPFGPYVNFVHFGGLMEIAVAWMAGYTWVKIARPEAETLWRSIAPVAAGATVLCFVAGLASAGKGAAALIVAGVVVLGVLGVRTRRARLAVVGAALLLGTASVPLVQRTHLGERIEDLLQGGESAMARAAALPAGTEMAADYWLTGVGFGAFRSVFTAYVPPGSGEQWKQLHNDWLELVLDGGLVAAVLLLWLLVGFARRAWRAAGVGRRRRGPPDLESLGLLIGIGALAIHALFDFNHQIPANALIWVVGCAVLLGRGESTPEEGAAT